MSTPPFVVLPRGQYASTSNASTGSLLAALGLRETDDSQNEWVLVKAKTSIATPASKVVTLTVTGGAIVYNCAPSAALSSANVAGVIDPGLTTTLVAGDVFWVQRGGVATVKSLSTVTAIGNLIGTKTTTAGSVGKLVITAATSAVIDQSNAIGKALSLHVTTTATCTVRLMNIH